MPFKRIMHRAQQLNDFMQLFENWYARILEFFELYPSNFVRYRSRKGLVYCVRKKTSDACSLVDALGSRGYFQHFEIEKKDTVIDIGANIGAFSVYAAALVAEGKVYAFEPVQENFEMLEKNIEANKLKNIKAFRLAVLSKGKKARIFLAKSNGRHSIFPIGTTYKKSIAVGSTNLEKIFLENRIKRCDFIKMDCEGAEYQIILNCPNMILGRIEKIAMEFHDFYRECDHLKLRQHLEENGFHTLVGGEMPGKKIGMIYATRGVMR